uniref:Ig-like domain-containing protein n=1 Tax=Pundamilia nyererei TaxID=303518 RepID=A0A3B4FZ29_9CICH
PPRWLPVLFCGAGPESHLSAAAVLLAWWIPLTFPPLDWRPDTRSVQHSPANKFSLQHYHPHHQKCDNILLQQTCMYDFVLNTVPVSKPYILTSNASPVEGSSMWMRCSVENGTEPIQYTWHYETYNGNATTFALGNSSIINMTNVNRNHTGWYRCVASNAVNSERSDRLWLNTLYVPQIDVTPPRTVKQGYTTLETEAVSLLCQAQSNPASQYVWFYNNSQVYTGQKFTITKILRVDAGDYTCLAQNTYLNTRTKKTISMTVYCEFPVTKPYLSLSEVSPVEGSTMWMRCNLENGTGPIQYVWQHETRSGNITIIAQGDSSVINVTDVNRNHTGWYRCVASNAVNSESSNRLWLDTICKLRKLDQYGDFCKTFFF